MTRCRIEADLSFNELVEKLSIPFEDLRQYEQGDVHGLDKSFINIWSKSVNKDPDQVWDRYLSCINAHNIAKGWYVEIQLPKLPFHYDVLPGDPV